MKITLKLSNGTPTYEIHINWKPKMQPFSFRHKVVPYWESLYKLSWFVNDHYFGDSYNFPSRVQIFWAFWVVCIKPLPQKMGRQIYLEVKQAKQ